MRLLLADDDQVEGHLGLANAGDSLLVLGLPRQARDRSAPPTASEAQKRPIEGLKV